MDASKLIDQKFASLGDWRGERLQAVRALVHEVCPDVIEEWKYMGSAVFNHHGILFVANPHSYGVRLTFLHGAKLADPKQLFNAELAGNARRAIKWEQGDAFDAKSLRSLIKSAMAHNAAKPAARKASWGTGGKQPVAKQPARKQR